jgi:hypothetical protein
MGTGCFATHDAGGSAGTGASATGTQTGANGSGKVASTTTNGSGVAAKGASNGTGGTSAGGDGTSPSGQGTPDTGAAGTGIGDGSVTPVSIQRLCSRGGSCRQVFDANVDKLDLLFVVDNSDSMANKQTKLRAQFPHLITVLTTGDKDGDGVADFPPATDLHLGVVTSDMGLPGVQGIMNCGPGLGPNDGVLQGKPNAAVMGCQESYPPFLSFKSGVGQPTQTAADFACVSVVGTGGCGFEHQLEAPLKALWPSTDPMPINGMNRIQFLVDPATGAGALGHGDVENSGFLRNDPVAGLSLIGIIVLTDEDDCSAADTRPFTPPQYLDPNDPLTLEGMNLRCHFNQPALYPVERYINGFKALRPGNENMVIFAAITGVPIDLVDSSSVLSQIDFSVPDQRTKFYQDILGDNRMQEYVDNQGTFDPSDDRLVHACIEADVAPNAGAVGQHGAADPAIRIVKVAQGFGENGIVQSICQPDYRPALDAIIARLSARLGVTCLAQPIARNSKGLVACDLLWELPPPSQAAPGTPTTCGAPGYGFLLPPDNTHPAKTDAGGALCRVAQLAVANQAGGPGPAPTQVNGTKFTEGWYYDDFSDEAIRDCRGDLKNRISFTANAKPPTGVTMVLDCAP